VSWPSDLCCWVIICERDLGANICRFHFHFCLIFVFCFFVCLFPVLVIDFSLLEYAYELLIFLSSNSYRNDEVSRSLCLWLLQRTQQSLLDTGMFLNSPPVSYTSPWIQFWTLVSNIESMFFQWERMLSSGYGFTEKPGSKDAAKKCVDFIYLLLFSSNQIHFFQSFVFFIPW
jgi:hypothetical protein